MMFLESFEIRWLLDWKQDHTFSLLVTFICFNYTAYLTTDKKLDDA